MVCKQILKMPALLYHASLTNKAVCRRNSPEVLKFRNMALKIYSVHNRRTFPNGRGIWVTRERGSYQRESVQKWMGPH